MLIGLLVGVIVIGILFYIVQLMPIPQPWKNIALLIVALIAIVWLLRILGMMPVGFI